MKRAIIKKLIGRAKRNKARPKNAARRTFETIKGRDGKVSYEPSPKDVEWLRREWKKRDMKASIRRVK